MVKDCIAEPARSGLVPYDWCYVNNFQQQHRPAALRLPAGVGRRLQHDMAQLIEYDLTEVMPGDYFYWEPEMRWADPRVHQAADALRVIRAERDVHDRVVAVSSRVGDLMSPAMFQDRYRDGLRGDLCHVR